MWEARVAIGVALALSACTSREKAPAATTTDACDVAREAGDWDDIRRVCTAEWQHEPTPERAARVAQAWALHDPPDPDQVLAWLDRVGDDPEYGIAWYLAGRVYLDRGDTAAADAAYARAIRNTSERDPALATRPALNRVYVALTTNDFATALERAAEAVELASRGADAGALMEAWIAVAEVAIELGDLRGAERALTESRAAMGDAAVPMKVRATEGQIALRRGRPRIAIDAFGAAATLAAADGDVFAERASRFNAIDAAVAAGEIRIAREELARVPPPEMASVDAEVADRYYRALTALHDRQEDPLALVDEALTLDTTDHWRYLLHEVAARTLVARGDLEGAIARFEASIAAIERLRAQVGYDELKAWVTSERRAPFEGLFALHADAGRAGDALVVAERMRARTLLDTLGAGGSVGEGALREAARAAAARGHDTIAALGVVRASRVAEPRDLRALRALGRGRALWTFVEAGGVYWLISVADGRAQIHRIGSIEEVTPLVADFVAALDDVRAAAALGAMLIPSRARPATGVSIVVAADGILARVPFAAVVVDGRRLVELHPLSTTPSLSTLSALEERGVGARGPSIVIGDPRGDLPAALDEAVAVAGHLGVSPLNGDAATRSRLVSANVPGVDVLHLATHSGVDTHGAHLVMADGIVSAATIASGSLHARLVVLASCASAAPVGDDEWGTLAISFLAGGSRGVVASLRSVDDVAARRFVERFYRAGGAGEPIGALATVQRAAIAAGEPAASWANFVFLGADNTVERAE